ncbi:hypothetical protein ABTM64_21070, partial [Acinetobacter baumannii]
AARAIDLRRVEPDRPRKSVGGERTFDRDLSSGRALREALDRLRAALQAQRTFDPATAELTVTIACTDYIQAAVIMPLVLALR